MLKLLKYSVAPLLGSSGLDGEGHLPLDLPEGGTVQSGEHTGGAGPLRHEHLGPGQR